MVIFMKLMMMILFSIITIDDSQLVDVHPSDSSLFVQGFEVYDEHLIIGTGLYGESVIGILNLEDGGFDIKIELDDEMFGEGITVTDNALWQLTWKNKTAYQYDLYSFELIDTFQYEGEGWGLTYNGDDDVLYMSDGSNIIDIRDAEDFSLVDSFEVFGEFGEEFDEEFAFDMLNELEYVDGFIYANQWQTYNIFKIDAATGEVVAIYDLKPLIYSVELEDDEIENMDTLNGIAHIENGLFYITGKRYPYIYEVDFSETED